ncbi:3-ketosteroid-delta-1-dehydrogenase [Lysinibacillus sp. FSL R7-0073]|uniref:3-ketosteroid-delta-1-dehydrogenase n=1 Tax=Lysinibacillus TaxID=400634 RepID=UPI00215B1D5D|nr:3-ketosteroid-delta-1-dehydrogenase [Lysinibacillus fusiformis]MCR8855161.1 3-ketosteroid-delta-1-dehydrogenase [Lysinibacillus fusiformis]MED4886743.1 3-ketosteroid-delta-1-dehydrogenase [Lysinibacillus fusiformis]WKT76854.1 3-ketosteroid-delta-1-dehydrogenase [Lysinibacillus fusiformis]
MILTKQEAIQALKKNKFIGFTIATGNIIMKKMNKTDYNIFVFEEGKEKPLRYVGSIMNVMATMSDKASNKDFVIVEQLPTQNNVAETQASENEVTVEEKAVASKVEEVEVVDETEEVVVAVDETEESRAIAGYEDLYKMTVSGRIITVRENRPLARCNDEYGFHIARLTKDGKASSHNVFELWKQTFPELEQTQFKGALKAKYGTGCKLIDKPGIHF